MWMFMTNSAVNKKTWKVKENLAGNHFHSILRIFDVLPSFSFATSETIRNYYLWTWYKWAALRFAKRLKT